MSGQIKERDMFSMTIDVLEISLKMNNAGGQLRQVGSRVTQTVNRTTPGEFWKKISEQIFTLSQPRNLKKVVVNSRGFAFLVAHGAIDFRSVSATESGTVVALDVRFADGNQVIVVDQVEAISQEDYKTRAGRTQPVAFLLDSFGNQLK